MSELYYMKKTKKYMTFSYKEHYFLDLGLTTKNNLDYIQNALATLSAEPRNSNDKTLANSTPFNACFFIRSTRISKISQQQGLFSMVACNGKGFALCSVPMFRVFEPVTRYRPQASKLQAVTSEKSTLELL